MRSPLGIGSDILPQADKAKSPAAGTGAMAKDLLENLSFLVNKENEDRAEKYV